MSDSVSFTFTVNGPELFDAIRRQIKTGKKPPVDYDGVKLTVGGVELHVSTAAVASLALGSPFATVSMWASKEYHSEHSLRWEVSADTPPAMSMSDLGSALATAQHEVDSKVAEWDTPPVEVDGDASPIA